MGLAARVIRASLSFLLCLLALSLASPTAAIAAGTQQGCSLDLDWRETRSRHFSLIYPDGWQSLASDHLEPYLDPLDSEYERMSKYFGTELEQPIPIRLYPDEETLRCLNGVIQPHPSDQSHLNIGTREIALLGDRIQADPQTWGANALNNYREELASLFVRTISADQAPPGLVKAVGAYARNPYDDIHWSSKLERFDPKSSLTWDELWLEPTTENPTQAGLARMTTIAFLVDVYGWDALVEMLKSFSVGEDPRRALISTYDVSIYELEGRWQEYLPLYVQGRWQTHAIYKFNLEPYREMLDAGAYPDASVALTEAISLLERTGQDEILQEAQDLLSRAQKGEEALAVARSARQALVDGEFQKSLDELADAREHYEELGDESRIEELETYQQWVEEVLELRKSVEEYEGQMSVMSGEDEEKVQAIGARLLELGDKDGAARARGVLQQRSSRAARARTIVAGILGALALTLIGHRVWQMGQGHHPEAELL